MAVAAEQLAFSTSQHTWTLARAGGALHVWGVGSAALTMCATALTTRLLGAREFGTYLLVFAFCNLLRQFFDSRSADVVLRHGGADSNRQQYGQVIAAAALLELAAAALASIGLVVATLNGWTPWGDHRAAIAALGVAWLLVQCGSSTAKAVILASDSAPVLGPLDALAAGTVLLGAAIGFAAHLSLTGLLTMTVCAQLATTVLTTMAAARTRVGRDFRTSMRAGALGRRDVVTGIRRTWRFAAGSNVLATIRLVQSMAPPVVIGSIAGPAGAGFYLLGQRLAGHLGGLVAPVMTLARPGLAVERYPVQQIRQMLKSSTAIVAVMSVATVAGALAFGTYLVPLAFGSEFLPAVPTITLMLGSAALGQIATPAGTLALLSGRLGALNALFAFAAVLQFVVLFALVETRGEFGAAIAWCLASAILCLGQFAIARSALLGRKAAV